MYSYCTAILKYNYSSIQLTHAFKDQGVTLPLQKVLGSRYFLKAKQFRNLCLRCYSIDSFHILYRWIRYIPEYRVVHLDLKGAPPSISYLKDIFPLLKKAGANTLLIEYEDMFPYWGKMVNASALNAFTVKQIQELLNAAKAHQLEVIPLVQTFGHMEHVLKLEEFLSLREVPNNPISICPSKDQAFPLVKEMIDQLMNLHQGHIKFLHIGKVVFSHI